MLFSGVAKAAIFTNLGTSIFVRHKEFDVLNWMAKGTRAAGTYGDIAVDLDNRDLVNLFHGVGAPFFANGVEIGARGDGAQRLVQPGGGWGGR